MVPDASHLRRATSRLRYELGRPVGEARVHRGDLALILAMAEVVERISSYAVHRETCGHHDQRTFYAGLQSPGSCTCGLTEVLCGRFPGVPSEDTWVEKQRRQQVLVPDAEP